MNRPIILSNALIFGNNKIDYIFVKFEKINLSLISNTYRVDIAFDPLHLAIVRPFFLRFYLIDLLFNIIKHYLTIQVLFNTEREFKVSQLLLQFIVIACIFFLITLQFFNFCFCLKIFFL